MIDWLCGLFFRKPLPPKKITPPSTPASAVLHVPKPIPASLNVDYQDQMRRHGCGITAAAANPELLRDLVDWGFLEEIGPDQFEVTDLGRAVMKNSGGWSPNPDPRTDR